MGPCETAMSESSGVAGRPTIPGHFQLTAMLRELPQVTVVAINGACADAGLGWAGACDLRHAAESADFIAVKNVSLREYIRSETERHPRTGASEDSRAAFRAFIEKREPVFKGV